MCKKFTTPLSFLPAGTRYTLSRKGDFSQFNSKYHVATRLTFEIVQNKNSHQAFLWNHFTISVRIMQTILGAGGAIGADLARELPKYTSKIRLVSRKPVKVNETDELYPADLSDPSSVDKAVEGSEVVYLVVGFEYNVKVWQKTWPPLVKAVIDACRKHHAKLVFFDNVYMYDRDYLAHMTEDTPVRPTSKKGTVRAQIAKMIMDEVQTGSLTALIARSADFCGPKNSIFSEVVYTNFVKGKKANWIADITKKHSLTFTEDAAKGTALLGNTPDAFNQVWHLPTIKTPFTGKEWIEMVAREMNVKPGISVFSEWMMAVLGVFVPVMREFHEMAYQYNRDYYFDSSKFEKRFNYVPVSAEEAVRLTVAGLRNQ
jgi:NAD dependent epimerase/dehydratase family.